MEPDYATRPGKARVTAAVRLETFSLPYRFSRWVRTVPSEMPRRRAIWALVCPAASRRSRSQCRAVSWGTGWRRRSASR